VEVAVRLNIGWRSGTRSRMMAKLGSGATATVSAPSSAIWVLHASRGEPLMSMPHDPHTPMRHDARQANEGAWTSLIFHRPSRTVMPGTNGMRKLSQWGTWSRSGSNRRMR